MNRARTDSASQTSGGRRISPGTKSMETHQSKPRETKSAAYQAKSEAKSTDPKATVPNAQNRGDESLVDNEERLGFRGCLVPTEKF